MPWTISGNLKGPPGTPGAATWDELQSKPAVIAAGANQAAARSAINAENAANRGVANGYASLDSGGKVPVSQLPNSIMEYQGTWNAATNSPSLSDGTGNAGDVYRVSTAGSRNLGSGSVTFDVGDYVIYSGSTWEKADTTDAVSTVAGRTGNVTLTVADIAGNTTTTLGLGGLELGHASDTTITRTGPGQVAVEGTAVVLAGGAGQVSDLSIVVIGANKTRTTGTGDFPFGVRLCRAVRFTQVTYRGATADVSGSMTVELRRNGSAVTGTSVTIAATSQVSGGTATGTWDFAAGDILTIAVTAVGGTPGKGLIADVAGLTT